MPRHHHFIIYCENVGFHLNCLQIAAKLAKSIIVRMSMSGLGPLYDHAIQLFNAGTSPT